VRYVLGEALMNIRHGGMVSLLSVFIVAVTTMLFSALYLLRNVVRAEVERFEENPPLVAFLREAATEDEARRLVSALEQLPGVARTVYLSKADALKRSRRIFGEQATLLLEGFEQDNPLPRSVEVYPQERFRRAESLDALAEYLRGLPAVEGIVFEEQGVRMMERLKSGLFLLGSLVALISVVVISFSIMLTIYARREELAILQLVGATAAFIRVPLLLQGCMEGLLGSEMGMGLFYLVYRRFGEELGLGGFLRLDQVVQVIVAATSIGVIGGVLPLRNRLRLVE
jgi:cell division transport system permease protein